MAKAMKIFIEFCERMEDWKKITKLRKAPIILQILLGCTEDDGEENLWTGCLVIPDHLLAICKVQIARNRNTAITGKIPTNLYLIGEASCVEYYERI